MNPAVAARYPPPVDSTRGERAGRGQEAAERLHWIDGLRAVAILLVVAHHTFTRPALVALHSLGLGAYEPLVLRTTAAGVELFFVISGAVLLRPYLRERRPFRVGRYALRRVQRIWPPYFVALVFSAGVLALAAAFPNWYSTANLPPVDWRGFLQHVPIVMFDHEARYSIAWWSLAVEILFYAALPLLLLLGRAVPLTAPRLLLLLAGSVVLSEALVRHLDFAVPIDADPLTTFFVFLPCFVLGILLALRDWTPAWGWACLGLGITGILTAALVTPLSYNAAYGFAWAGIAVLASNGGRLRNWLSRPGMVWLGERSYSLFLIHLSVLHLVYWACAQIEPGRTLLYFGLTRSLGLALAVAATLLLFHAVEKRFARGLVTADRW